MTNTRLLRARMIEKNKTAHDLAAEVGICEMSLRNKINNITEFKASEIFTLCKSLDIAEYEAYFFCPNVDK